MQRLSITYRLALLLALLSTAPLVLLVFNRTNEEMSRQWQARMQSCEQIAISSALHLRRKDYAATRQLLDHFAGKTDSVTGLRLVRFDGLVIHQLGLMDESDGATGDDPNYVSVPITRDNRKWGRLDASFRDSLAESQLWIIGKAFATTLGLNLLMFTLLLRRSLAVLDSGSVVPRRVKNTLDTIAGGVVILDGKGRIVMANDAFRSSCDRENEDLIGQTLNGLPFRSEEDMLPWVKANQERSRVSGATLFLPSELNGERCFVVNATPIFDSKDAVAGTLISFEDITALERQNKSLMLTLAELEVSKEQIQQQNSRLQELASKDALTGTFNRRSLFEHLEGQWNLYLAKGMLVNCIMLDVDHFKKLNDNYGHAAGDQVLRDVSRTIQEAVDGRGFVGRYGGEEFCVVLSNMDAEAAAAVAETVRSAIATKLAQPYSVTASFGVACSGFGAPSYQLMLEQADLALYAAKHGGRNAVCCWSEELAEAAAQPAPAAAVIPHAEQPISYHAVASLHAALAYRDADTALHSQRVAEMSVTLGRGLMPVSQLYVLEIGALLHDIGKIGVPDAVLLKPSKLDVDEWKVMEAHARMGVEIVDSSFDSVPLSEIVRYHHYRFDGSNTPVGGPVGTDIPIGARIVCIVDAYDAMVSNRVYRKGRPAEAAFEELRRCAGSQFDPELVERFIKIQIGWRPDSRHVQGDYEDRLAISVGHFTERTMSAFESKDTAGLIDSLQNLGRIADQHDMPAIKHLSGELSRVISATRESDWEFAAPILQDLLDMCLAVQRAHIRDVAARPQVTENCPQSSYYSTARAWWEADQV
jgi:diguanylate cyclase (GGDEF)-like protein